MLTIDHDSKVPLYVKTKNDPLVENTEQVQESNSVLVQTEFLK